ncbi:MAG TPA: tetratricopeptide repeat protein [Thermoanaerobaculia bacterium]|nr:tetratricopeptide repeat protein [Thermoanaerobaculia bacterium]
MSLGRTWRPFGAAAIVLLASSCATPPKAPPPRDRFPLDPREGASGAFPPDAQDGWRSLLAGNASGARAEFEVARRQEPNSVSVQVGEIEALVAGGALPEARAACAEAMPGSGPGDATLPLLVACGEAEARSGQPIAGYDLYRQAAIRAPERAGIAARAAELRMQARDQAGQEAQEAAARKDWAAARLAAARAIEIDPDSAAAREAAGDVERAAGEGSAALERYGEALQRNPSSHELQGKIARLAAERGDWASAVRALDRLAAEDPSFEAEAEEARLSFRLSNWPDAERAAARASRLTRGDAARLVWWMVPEVRQLRVSEGIIASDIVDRSDREQIARAVGLGLLDVDRETHRARPDAALTFGAAARLDLRLYALLAAPGSAKCLSDRPVETLDPGEAIRVARECGILDEKDGSPVTGPAFTKTVDRIRDLARPGEKR